MTNDRVLRKSKLSPGSVEGTGLPFSAYLKHAGSCRADVGFASARDRSTKPQTGTQNRKNAKRTAAGMEMLCYTGVDVMMSSMGVMVDRADGVRGIIGIHAESRFRS